MNDDIGRVRQDLQTIQNALGLDIWTRRDIRRGFLGTLGGAVASLLLALWMRFNGDMAGGMLGYLVILQAIIILKAAGYQKNTAPSPGTQREVSFYNRYYFTGTAIIICYFFWGRWLGTDIQVLFATTVVIAGMWYVFYGISSPSRSLSITGAVPLLIGGFLLPEAAGPREMFYWLGLAASVGCSFEAALLLAGLRQAGGAANPPAPAAQPPLPGGPKAPLVVHATH